MLRVGGVKGVARRLVVVLLSDKIKDHMDDFHDISRLVRVGEEGIKHVCSEHGFEG